MGTWCIVTFQGYWPFHFIWLWGIPLKNYSLFGEDFHWFSGELGFNIKIGELPRNGQEPKPTGNLAKLGLAGLGTFLGREKLGKILLVAQKI